MNPADVSRLLFTKESPMSIRVTCPSCHTRFDVSDKFAGKTGPCPKCKHKIQIPSLEEQVEVHAPESFGPKDSQGQSVLKPLERQETNLSAVQIVGIIASIVLAIGAALGVRFSSTEPDSTQMWIILGSGATLLAPVLVLAGYTFLRNQELGAYSGIQLWIRSTICGAGFAILWLAVPLVAYTVGDYEMIPMVIGIAAMIALGAGISFVTLELDYMMGILHYGMYFAACLGLRWIIGVGVLPFASEI